MKTALKVLGIILLILVLVPVSLIGYGYLTHINESYSSGDAYGFHIGESHEEVFERAQELKVGKEIVEIHRWPAGSFHSEFSEDDLESALNDDLWIMIVSRDWWRDEIFLNFEGNKLVEISRYRSCCELP